MNIKTNEMCKTAKNEVTKYMYSTGVQLFFPYVPLKERNRQPERHTNSGKNK
jgi:hypothetical protein